MVLCFCVPVPPRTQRWFGPAKSAIGGAPKLSNGDVGEVYRRLYLRQVAVVETYRGAQSSCQAGAESGPAYSCRVTRAQRPLERDPAVLRKSAEIATVVQELGVRIAFEPCFPELNRICAGEDEASERGSCRGLTVGRSTLRLETAMPGLCCRITTHPHLLRE